MVPLLVIVMIGHQEVMHVNSLLGHGSVWSLADEPAD